MCVRSNVGLHCLSMACTQLLTKNKKVFESYAIILSEMRFLLGTTKSLYGFKHNCRMILKCHSSVQQSLRRPHQCEKNWRMYQPTHSGSTATVYTRLYSPTCWNITSDLNIALPCSCYFHNLSFHNHIKKLRQSTGLLVIATLSWLSPSLVTLTPVAVMVTSEKRRANAENSICKDCALTWPSQTLMRHMRIICQ